MRRIAAGWLALPAVGAAVACGTGADDESSGPAKAGGEIECARYASPSGSDRNPGTRARPFQTAQRLARSLRAGEAGCLRRGRYLPKDGDYVLDLRRAGRTGAPIVLRSSPGERATLIGIVIFRPSADRVHLDRLTIVGTG